MPKGKVKATVELMGKLTGKTVFPLHTCYEHQLVTSKLQKKEKFKEFKYEGEMLFVFLMINVPYQTYNRLKELMNSDQPLDRIKELIKEHKVLR